jgi:hypothetical protein
VREQLVWWRFPAFADPSFFGVLEAQDEGAGGTDNRDR